MMVETRGWVADSDTLKGAAACEALWDQGEVGEWTQGKSSSMLDAGWPAAMASRVAERELMLPHALTKRLVNHAPPNDVTEGYASDWTIRQLREPAQRIADRIEALTMRVD